jgi:hypothetical protein
MNIAMDILARPLNICLYVWHEVQINFIIVNDSLMGRRPIEFAVVGQLVQWVFLALMIALVVYVILKYVLESAFSGPLIPHDILPVLGSVFWRLVAILVIYAVLSVLLFAFTSYGHMITSGMDYVPARRH